MVSRKKKNQLCFLFFFSSLLSRVQVRSSRTDTRLVSRLKSGPGTGSASETCLWEQLGGQLRSFYGAWDVTACLLLLWDLFWHPSPVTTLIPFISPNRAAQPANKTNFTNKKSDGTANLQNTLLYINVLKWFKKTYIKIKQLDLAWFLKYSRSFIFSDVNKSCKFTLHGSHLATWIIRRDNLESRLLWCFHFW